MRGNADVLYSCLLADLGRRIDPACESWPVDSSAEQVACYQLRRSLLKKFNPEPDPAPLACKRALEKFQAVNKRVGEWSIPYETSLDEMLVGGVKEALYRFWFTGNGGPEPLVSTWDQVWLRGGTGKGASVNCRDPDMYSKLFNGAVSSTQGLPDVWDACMSRAGLLRDAVKRARLAHGYKIVDSNNCSFVNKTVTIARLIASEPVINMWFQKGLGSLLADQLRVHWGIDMAAQQQVNGELARVGSITGGLATIDLESASDSMGLEIMRYLLPRSMFDFLQRVRSPSMKLPNREVVALNMISTQGNGYNSALQTVLFTAVIQSAYNSLGIPMKGRGQARSRNFGCFGDDMIVESRAYHRVTRLLHLLGFVVNADKSFVEGQFRESCGADFFCGANVRGVYIESLNTVQNLFTAINTLNRWSARTGVFLPRTVGYLASLIHRGNLNKLHQVFIPPDENDDAGIHMPASYASERVKRYTGVAGHMVYQADRPCERFFIVIGGFIWTFGDQTYRAHYNPEGLEAVAIAGGLRGYKVTLRQSETAYKTLKGLITPRWDYLPPRPLEVIVPKPGYEYTHVGQGESWTSVSTRFVDACALNLC